MESHAGGAFWIWFLILALIGLAGPDLALRETPGGVGLTMAAVRSQERVRVPGVWSAGEG